MLSPEHDGPADVCRSTESVQLAVKLLQPQGATAMCEAANCEYC